MELFKKELKLLKEENGKLNQELEKIQYDKDKLDAEVKSKEKLRKIKKNTKLFNDIIKNSLMMVKFAISTSQSIHLIKWKNVLEERPVQESLVMDLLI